MSAPSFRTRLKCESMEAREVMSADLGIDPGLIPQPDPSATVMTAAQDDQIPVPTPLRAGAPLPAARGATPGVTRVAPTARDRMFMSRLANKQWYQVVSFTNPLSGNFVEQHNEMVLIRGGRYTFQSVWVEYTPFGPVSYPLFTEGRWFVQTNGRLVLEDSNPANPQRYNFMTLRAVNNRVLTTSDNGRWFRVNSSQIPGPA